MKITVLSTTRVSTFNAREEAIDDIITLALFVSGQQQTRRNNMQKQQDGNDTAKLSRLLLVAPIFATANRSAR
jgi:hypothetical protein